MIKQIVCALGLITMWTVVGCSTTEGPQTARDPGTGAQLFEQMGGHSWTITTSSPLAQQYFDQALTWMYGFNHDEAIRSFAQAAALDPDCAMAWWGVALCHGPNYNDIVMTPQRNADAWNALQEANARLHNTSPVERALIEALNARYANPAPDDRSELDQAYADAMAVVYERYPFDADIGTLYAEAMMDQMPWKLYSKDYVPAKNTPIIEEVLERAMRLAPESPGPYHLYIHAVEPSANPYRGLDAASRLSDLVPASGHLLHMPSHIYVKTGRWQRAIEQNVKALASDRRYRSQTPDQGFQYIYQVHNAHMLAFAAMMNGQESKALTSAQDIWDTLPEPALKSMGPFIEPWLCAKWDVYKRFGRWDELLSESGPPEFLPITTAIWRAHRAIAYAAKKDFDNARAEQEIFERIRTSIPEDQMTGPDPSRLVLEVAMHFIAGEMELQQGRWDAAVEHLEKGIAAEDSLSYGEPPVWTQPTRHTLGAVYMASGDFVKAERVYRDDLAIWPENGWSLFGLYRSLERQGRADEAAIVKERFDRIWAGADAPTMTSCRCIPEM